MRACVDLAELIASPVGRCISGPTWLYFYPRIGLCGFVVWGRPGPDDLEALVRVLHVELGAPPHVALVDARRVEGVDPRGFAVLERYVREQHAALARAVERLAVVRPGGLVGAVTAGFFGVTPPPYPVELFDDRARAIEWLGVPDAASVLAEIAEEEARASSAPPLLRDLSAFLETSLSDAVTLARAARALGMSERSLQRKLGEHGTTFQDELAGARVRVAERLLRDGDAPLTQIAFETGCASLASFSAAFRRRTGETPSAFRARARLRREG